MTLICRQYVLRRGGGVLREKFAVRLAPEERNQLEQMVRAGEGFSSGCDPGSYSAQDRPGLIGAPGKPGSGHVATHGVPDHAALCRGWAGGGAERSDPSPSASQRGRPGRGPSHRPGKQPGSRGTRPLDAAPAGGPDGGVGGGGGIVPRGGTPQAEKNVLKPWQNQQWRIPTVGGEFVAALVSSTGQALNTQRKASLYATFPAAEARRIAWRLEFHYTPRHGSRLKRQKSSSASSPAVASQDASLTWRPSTEQPKPSKWSVTKLKPASTGASAYRTPEPTSIASIHSRPRLTEH